MELEKTETLEEQLNKLNDTDLHKKYNIEAGFMPTAENLLYIVSLLNLQKKAAFEIVLLPGVTYHFCKENPMNSFLLSNKWPESNAFIKDCFIQKMGQEHKSDYLAFKPYGEKHVIAGLASLPPIHNIVYTILNEK